MKIRRYSKNKFWLGVFLYPYLHCWRVLKENKRGRVVNKYV